MSLALSSRLISSMGSTVLVTFPQRPHRTSLWSWPAKVLCTTQLHETLVLPREVVCRALSVLMKHSWASCCE